MSSSPRIDLRDCAWRKSSYSNGQGGACVEIADHLPVIPVRDSKVPGGPVLIFPTAAWSAFVSSIKSGELNA
ncbi:DUF397 domain-containing protein [Streptomyces sp. NPDC057654]|uniref:DUF397 domain-containing protein n=1 Tax=Streptomyces sp. NPDC057654 TaxID=3346196 RepID=UPI003682E86C